MAKIRETVLRDPRYPVSRIADDLPPYLRVLADKFNPEQVVLFGSYAYGSPTADSDVDLLIIKPLRESPVKEASEIRKAWWPVRLSGRNLGFDLLIESPEGHAERLRAGGTYYHDIASKGLRLV